jgi:hypothetical protein
LWAGMTTTACSKAAPNWFTRTVTADR